MFESLAQKDLKRALTGISLTVVAALAGFDLQAAVYAPATSTGDYTVSYSGCSGCTIDWLEESSTTAIAWQAVAEGSVSFVGKADGTYHYRSVSVYLDAYFNYQVLYSDIATVVVGSDSPPRQTLAEQLAHEYTVRVGYYEGDSRPDLFVERTRGGSGNDGTLQRTILRAASGRFEPVAPSVAGASAARGWPLADVDVTLRDVNVDGFVDLVMTGIASLSGMSGMPGQIVFAPGRVLEPMPQAVRGITGELRELGSDLRGYLANREYFTESAPLTVVSTTYYDYSCQYSGFDVSFYVLVDYCYPYVMTSYLIVPDYTGFASAALDIWNYESAIIDGAIGAQAGYESIEAVLEESFGTELGERELHELFGEAEVIDATAERGVELFTALAGIGNAVAQEAQSEEGSAAGSTMPDSVLLTGRRIIGIGPFHTALQYGGSTISAHDDDPRALYDGTLVSQVDWAPDHPLLTLLLGTVTAAVPAPFYWQNLLSADARYGDDLRYDLFPSLGSGGFNSNGFVAGIIAATYGTSSTPMARFVGGEMPVPRGEFN